MTRVIAVPLAAICYPFVSAYRGLLATGRALLAAVVYSARWVHAKWAEIISYASVAMIGVGAGLEWGLPVGLMTAGGLAYLEYLMACLVAMRRAGK